MAISKKQQEALLERVEAAGLRPNVLEHVRALLSKEEVTDEDVGKILAAIQGDIEEDFAKIPAVNDVLEDDEAYVALLERQEAELKKVEAETRGGEQAAELSDVKKRLGME